MVHIRNTYQVLARKTEKKYIYIYIYTYIYTLLE